MKKLILWFKARADRRLRERCVNYASRSRAKYHNIYGEATWLYDFINGLNYPTPEKQLEQKKKS